MSGFNIRPYEGPGGYDVKANRRWVFINELPPGTPAAKVRPIVKAWAEPHRWTVLQNARVGDGWVRFTVVRTP